MKLLTTIILLSISFISYSQDIDQNLKKSTLINRIGYYNIISIESNFSAAKNFNTINYIRSYRINSNISSGIGVGLFWNGYYGFHFNLFYHLRYSIPIWNNKPYFEYSGYLSFKSILINPSLGLQLPINHNNNISLSMGYNMIFAKNNYDRNTSKITLEKFNLKTAFEF